MLIRSSNAGAEDLISQHTTISRAETIAWSAWLIAIFTIYLVSAFGRARLPLRINLPAFAGAYWGGTAVRAIFVAVLLAAIHFPPDQVFLQLLQRYSEQKVRFLFLGVLCVWMFALFGVAFGLVIVVDALAIAELLDRKKQQFGAALLDVLVPSVYLFAGVLLVYLLNHAIAGFKFAGQFDTVFENADHFLFHTDVLALSRWMVRRVPRLFLPLMEFVYFSLFGQIGAAIIITALLRGRRYAMCYVRALLTGYAIALVCFFFWPSIGPFSIYSAASRTYLSSLPTYSTQLGIWSKAVLLKTHNLLPGVATVDLADYYIGFPSMHVALPVIAIWFLRKWRKIAFVLVAFDVLLLISIIALQWHYLVDLAGGFLVAALAVLLNEKIMSVQGRRRVASHTTEKTKAQVA